MSYNRWQWQNDLCLPESILQKITLVFVEEKKYRPFSIIPKIFRSSVNWYSNRILHPLHIDRWSREIEWTETLKRNGQRSSSFESVHEFWYSENLHYKRMWRNILQICKVLEITVAESRHFCLSNAESNCNCFCPPICCIPLPTGSLDYKNWCMKVSLTFLLC